MPWRRTKIHLGGLVAVGLLVIVMGLTTLRMLRDYENAAEEADHARHTLTTVEALLSDLKDAETGERGYLLTRDRRYLEPYTMALPHISMDLAELTTNVDAAPAAISQVKMRVASMLSLLAQTIESEETGAPARETVQERADAAKAVMDSIRASTDQLIQAEQGRLTARTAAMRGRRQQVRRLVAWGSIVILVFLMAFGLFLNRLIRARDQLIEAAERSRDVAEGERDRLETTLESIGDAVIVTDAHARVTLINPVAAQLTGWSQSESLGMEIGSVFPIFNAKSGETVANPVKRVLEEGVIVGLANHTVLRHRSGREFPIDDSGAPIRDRTGAIRGTVLVFRDVSERYRTQRELEDAEERYRLMFENNPQPMWVYDVQTMGFLAVNNAAIAQYGYSRDEFLSLTLRDIRPEEDVPALVADIGNSRGLHRSGPWRHMRKDGSVLLVDIIAHPFHFKGREARVIIASDITERVNAESAVRNTTERLSTIVNTSPLAICTLDPDGAVTSWNQASTDMFGWTAEEVIGRPLSSIAGENSQFDGISERYERGDRIAALETSRRHKMGHLLPVTLWSAPLADHEGRRTGTLIISADISQRKEDERALAQTEAGFRLLFENYPQPMWVFHAKNFQFLEVNQTAIAHYGYSRDEFLAMRATDLRSPQEVDRFTKRVNQETAAVAQNVGSWQHRLKSGKTIEVEIVAHRLTFQGQPAILSVLTDVTEKRKLDEQLRQSQKLEAVGRLAGGVAHDFNNLLTVIIGYADLLRTSIQSGSSEGHAVEEIGLAAERASSLTRQLLAFSRQQVLKAEILNLNESIEKIQPMLARLIGENVQIATELHGELWAVSADPGQIDQIIVNLAVNARDAMSNGGKLAIQTSNVVLTEDYSATHLGVTPGEYVLMSVSDTGHGMDAETQAHIFEPFFTTKEVGRGTGLGLATVYGIVKQSGGEIGVYSEVGMGTSIHVYLPRLHSEDRRGIKSAAPSTPQPGSESILLVEDEDSLRRLIAQLLERAGYAVRSVATVDEALKVCEDRSIAIDLLITDLVLTKGTGWDIAAHALQLRPGLKTLFMSGYSESAAFGERSLDEGINFIQKPFSMSDLRARIRKVLEAAPPESLG
ncbi:MAG TPA: PAS domain S-box protein [Bryobacteraceae bacterium]|nr:PAS domain S-box protein [Bryobacteraceae bacterium]